jgi:hypothetical protein
MSTADSLKKAPLDTRHAGLIAAADPKDEAMIPMAEHRKTSRISARAR